MGVVVIIILGVRVVVAVINIVLIILLLPTLHHFFALFLWFFDFIKFKFPFNFCNYFFGSVALFYFILRELSS